MYPTKRTSESLIVTLLYDIWCDGKIESHGNPLHYFFVPQTRGLHHSYARLSKTHGAQWNATNTQCIVVTNQHTQQVPWSTWEPGQTQSRIDSVYPAGVKISWDKHLAQRKLGYTVKDLPFTHTHKGSNSTLIHCKRLHFSLFLTCTELQFKSSCQPT